MLFATRCPSGRNNYGEWCQARNLSPLPAAPVTLAAFIACEAKRGSKPSSITRRIAGIRHAHLLAGHQPPTQSEMLKATMRGIRRTIGIAPNRKAPLTADCVRAMVEAAPDSLIGLRDRAPPADRLRRWPGVLVEIPDPTNRIITDYRYPPLEPVYHYGPRSIGTTTSASCAGALVVAQEFARWTPRAIVAALTVSIP